MSSECTDCTGHENSGKEVIVELTGSQVTGSG